MVKCANSVVFLIKWKVFRDFPKECTPSNGFDVTPSSKKSGDAGMKSDAKASYGIFINYIFTTKT